jgi:hypothetical protein
MLAVSVTPHAPCMRCHWYRMQGACGIIDTACTVHAMSLTAHAKYNTACTIDERFERSWQPLKGISIKIIYVPELPTPPLKKYINLKGLSNKKFSCMRCHWHRMHDFCVRKSIISRRIRSRIQKSFSSWIRGPGGTGIVSFKKNRGSKISWHRPFKNFRFSKRSDLELTFNTNATGRVK